MFQSTARCRPAALRSSTSLKLLDSLKRGEVDLILTTEEKPGQGGETLTEMPLRWVGAQGGLSWKRKPLKLAFCNVCIFRAGVLRKLDDAGIDWEMAVDSDDDRSVEALISADLAVGALLEDSVPPHLEAIQSGGALPDLGIQRINMYGADSRKEVLGELADMLRQGFAASRGPVAVPSAATA